MSQDLIDQAKAVIANHEGNVAAADLDAIMSNMASDVVVLASDAPLVEGAAACRAMYAGLLQMGSWEFGHDYHGADVIDGAAVLHGVSRGSLTLPDGSLQPLVNNFVMVLKRDHDGRLKAWRVAFAPDGSLEPQ